MRKFKTIYGETEDTFPFKFPDKKFAVSGIRWKSNRSDLPEHTTITLPAYVYLDTRKNWWGPWIRAELSLRFDGKALGYEAVWPDPVAG